MFILGGPNMVFGPCRFEQELDLCQRGRERDERSVLDRVYKDEKWGWKGGGGGLKITFGSVIRSSLYVPSLFLFLGVRNEHI